MGAASLLLDIASYARRGPADRVQLGQEEIQLLHRTVRRAPEVMVKVLTRGGRGPKAKLVHKLVFSMPAATPPEGLFRGAQAFARETFGAKHGYAMVLHTDEPNPHIHMVVKAVSEEGVRLNIRKAALRDWRRDFARHLRALGISANATDKAVRGTTRANLSDGMYRAMQRSASRRIPVHMRSQGMERKAASEASSRESLLHTRAQVGLTR